jgi:hypothetical protein
MTKLFNALFRIQNWLRQNYSDGSDALKPGLSLDEIESKLQQIPYKLPLEVHELYQWSSGSEVNDAAFLFGSYEPKLLLELDNAIEIAKSPIFNHEHEEVDLQYGGKRLFPVFEFEGSYLCVVGDWDDSYTSPMVMISDICEIYTEYTSLTNMMNEIADLYEGNNCFIDELGRLHYTGSDNSFDQYYEDMPNILYKVFAMDLKYALSRNSKYLLTETLNSFQAKYIYSLCRRLDKELIDPRSIPEFSELFRQGGNDYKSQIEEILTSLGFQIDT